MKYQWLIALALVILVAAGYAFGRDYLQQRRAQDSLSSQIASASQILAQTPPPPAGLEQQLTAAQDNLTAVASAFPGQINSTSVIDAILRLAEEIDVKAIPLVTRPWSLEKRGAHNYHVLRLNVSFSGSFAQLETFTARLEKGDFPTLVVEELNVSNQTEPPATGAVAAAPVAASLDLAIYTRSSSDG